MIRATFLSSASNIPIISSFVDPKFYELWVNKITDDPCNILIINFKSSTDVKNVALIISCFVDPKFYERWINKTTDDQCNIPRIFSFSQWEVVCYPFYKFFNYDEDFYAEEKYVPSLDWSRPLHLSTMMHGCSAFLFYFNNTWFVSSYCGMNVYAKHLCLQHHVARHEISKVVTKEFWKLWEEKKYILPDPSLQRCCIFIGFTVYPLIHVCISSRVEVHATHRCT